MAAKTEILGDERDRVSSLPLISLEGVTVRYEADSEPVLRDISFGVLPGETVLLAGPSGCGKSTLALLTAGLIPEAVEAEVSGQIHRTPSVQSPGGTAMVFQDPTTQFCMPKIADEMAFGLENQMVDRGQMPPLITDALMRTTLGVHPNEEHRHLSGGQQQKLAIASALVTRPSLLILDEPTSNLDPESTQQVFDEIATLRASGQTMVIIEHKFRPLLDIVDRVVLFSRDGQIRSQGPANEIISREWEWMVAEGVVSQTELTPVVPELPDNQDAAVLVHSACVSHGDVPVWKNLDVTIPRGKLTAIVGPNGAGKSTLLQAMSGLTRLTEGDVVLLGKPLTEWKRTERMQAVSYCFQNPELQFVYERVADEFANERLSGPIPRELEDELRDFGLAGTALQSPFSLSQGQKRRLSVAVMLHDDHEVYLLDEPTYGQDAKTQAAIMGMMADLIEQGKTVVFTSHDMNLVRQYASHVVVIADGSCLFQGAPGDLFLCHDLLRKAHLAEVHAPLPPSDTKFDAQSIGMKAESHETKSDERLEREIAAMQERSIRHPTDRLNPAWMTLALGIAGLIGTFSWNFTQATVAFCISLVWVFFIARVKLRFALKWYAFFIVIYAFYIWSFTAYAAVPPGLPSFRIGWINLSWYGMREGLLVALRMFSSVGYLISLTGTLELTDLMVALCKNVRIPPKFAFGILAGLRLAPLLHSEWHQLKLARQLRGKDARFAMTRPVLYAIPILSQGVRMSERVAVAMEARGMVGNAARSPQARTYFRDIRVGWYDWVVAAVAVAIPILLLVLL